MIQIDGGNAASGVFHVSPLTPLDGFKWFSVSKRGSDHIVSIFGEIGVGIQKVEDLLISVGSSGSIEFNINSIGGDSLTALRIHNALCHRATVATIRGACFSSAVEIAHTARRVRIEASASMMVHQARAAVFGDMAQVSAAANHLRKTNKAVLQLLRRRCPHAAKWMAGGDFYFTAEESVSEGLADEVFTDPPAEAPIAPAATDNFEFPTEDELAFNDLLAMFGPLSVRSRNNFMRNLSAWAAHNAREITP